MRSTPRARHTSSATPDSTLGMASSGLTLVLAGMGEADRATTKPVIPLLMFAKTLLDAANGAYLTVEQITKHKKVCSYCSASAIPLIASPSPPGSKRATPGALFASSSPSSERPR